MVPHTWYLLDSVIHYCRRETFFYPFPLLVKECHVGDTYLRGKISSVKYPGSLCNSWRVSNPRSLELGSY